MDHCSTTQFRPAPLVRIFVAVVLGALCFAVGPRSVNADPARDADAAFKRGSQEFERGNYVVAAEAFDRAFAIMPHGVASYSGAVAWQKAGEPARAADGYRHALGTDQLSPTQERDARDRLTQLAPTLGRVTITAPAGTRLTVAHVRDAAVPVDAYLSPGSYQVRGLTTSGEPLTGNVAVLAGQVAAVQLEPPAPSAEPGPASGPVPPDDSSSGAGDGDLLPVFGWVSAGAGVAAAGVAMVLGSLALSAKDDYYASEFRDADARDQADGLRTATNVTWVVAGVLATTGVVLLITSAVSDDESPSTQASLAVGVSPSGVQLTGRF